MCDANEKWQADYSAAYEKFQNSYFNSGPKYTTPSNDATQRDVSGGWCHLMQEEEEMQGGRDGEGSTSVPDIMIKTNSLGKLQGTKAVLFRNVTQWLFDVENVLRWGKLM